MSSRQLRKLQQQRELEQSKLANEPEESEDEGEIDTQPAVKPSIFANLSVLEGEDGENSDESNHEDGGLGEEVEQASPEPVKRATTTKASKKKKKAKKKAALKGESHTVTDPAHGTDDIDAALRELSLKAGTQTGWADESISGGSKLDPEYERVCTLLGIHTQHLKVGNEMRNLFGRTAVDNHDDAGGPVGRGGRRRQRGANQQVDLETALKGHHAPGKGLPELTLRRNIFIQGKEDWPRASTGGLTMAVVEHDSADGTVEFRYVHDQAYETIQQQFDVMVEMGDPQNLIGLLQRNPYHISLLLQVSKVAKDQSDHALSSDLLERALFTFARAGLSSFNNKLSQGKARLDFARPENRELWLAGYHYIKSLMMKGTYRTALEWAKLLYSLDPEQDPYCMLLMIHHLSLRAHEFDYLTSVYGNESVRSWSRGACQMAPSMVLAAMNLKQASKCRELLGKSILEMPWLFCKLFQELNLDPAPPSIWGVEPRTDAEALFTEIYVRQTKDLWNTPEGTSLLMEVAHATEKQTVGQVTQIDNSEITLDVARFCYLDNTPALMAMVPSKLMHRIPNSDSDPLPPDTNIFSWPSQKRAFAAAEQRGSGEGLANHFDPIAALRGLIPGFDALRARGAEDDSGEEDLGEEPQDEAGLREHLGQQMTEPEVDAVIHDMEEDGAPTQGPGLLYRAYQYLWGSRGQITANDGSGSEEDTDTDDGEVERHATDRHDAEVHGH